MTLARAVAAVAILMSSSATAWGQKRTDVVTLLNGDRITGEIISLNRGRLELKTDDAGTIDIEWNKIAGVEAARGFEIETEDGRRVLGSLARAADRGGMVVAASEGVVSLSMSEVTRITPIGTSFWRKLDGSLDAGFTYSQSSGIAQTTLNADTSYRRPAFVVRLDGSATLTTRRDDTERDDRGFMELSYVRYRGRRWFVSGATRFESNESLGLLLRSQVAGLVGQRIVNTNRAQFALAAGLVVNDERVSTRPRRRTSREWSAWRRRYYTYDRPKTQFDARVQYLPEPEQLGTSALSARHWFEV